MTALAGVDARAHGIYAAITVAPPAQLSEADRTALSTWLRAGGRCLRRLAAAAPARVLMLSVQRSTPPAKQFHAVPIADAGAYLENFARADAALGSAGFQRATEWEARGTGFVAWCVPVARGARS